MTETMSERTISRYNLSSRHQFQYVLYALFFNSFNTAEITSPLTKIIGSLQLVSYISYIYS